MAYVFAYATHFDGLVGSWRTGAVTTMRGMFERASAFSGTVGAWDTRNVVDMHGMFSGARAFNKDVGGWNTAKVIDMGSMFSGAIVFNKPIRFWVTSSVTTMSSMFCGASAFNQPVGDWDTANVTNMSGMFCKTNVFNQDLSKWNTGNVQKMDSMFSGARVFNQNISAWTTDKVTDMSSMFRFAVHFNQNIGGWNTSNVTRMKAMFFRARVFNQNIGGWNTSKVTDMSIMFRGARAFNQNLGEWNVGQVRTMSDMLTNAGLSAGRYSSALVGWSKRPRQSNVILDAPNLHYYKSAVSGRAKLIGTSHWTINDAGMGPWMVSPAQPDTPKLTPGVQLVKVTWGARASATNSAITGFTVNVYVSGVTQTESCSTNASGQSCDVTGLDPEVVYEFAVSAVFADGDSSESSSKSGSPLPMAPDAPVVVSVTPGFGTLNHAVRVIWRAPATNGAPIIEYFVRAYNASDNSLTGRICRSVTLTCDVHQLAPGKRYYFEVFARNSAGSSDPGRSSEVVGHSRHRG
jgi:surface protein